MDFVLLFYGAALFFLCTTCIILNIHQKSKKFLPWLWFGFSAFLLGLDKWLGVISNSLTSAVLLELGRSILLGLSLLCLLEFCRRSLLNLNKLKFGLWIYIPIILFGVFVFTDSKSYHAFSASILYIIGLPCGLLVSYVFWSARLQRDSRLLEGIGKIKAILISFLVLFFLFLYSGFHLILKTDVHEREHVKSLVLSDARLLANALGKVDHVTFDKRKDASVYPQYLQMHSKMSELTQLASFAKALYLVSLKEGKPTFVVGSRPQIFPGDTVPSFGRSVPEKAILDALHSRQPTMHTFYEELEGEAFYTVFIPLLNPKGEVFNLLGIELDNFKIRNQIVRVRIYAVFIVMAFLAFLIAGYAFLAVFALKNLELELQKNNLDKALLNLKEAEAELARSEETFRGILNNSPNAIFGFDRDLKAIFWNHGAERLYGYRKDEVVNEKNPILSLEVTQLLGIKHMVSEVKSIFSGSSFQSELTHKTKDGQADVVMTLFPVKDPQGHILFGMGVAQDISERKKLEEDLRRYSEKLEALVKERTAALQKSELMFRSLFESAKDGILIIEADSGNIIDVNPYLLDLVKYAKDEVKGVEYQQVAVFRNSQILKKCFSDLKDRTSVFYSDVLLKTGSGKELCVEVRASLYEIEDKKIIQCNIRDITERKKVEKVKTEFVSMVSHELRTPLSAIKEGVEIVADGTQGKLNKNQIQCLGIALSNINRLNRLIRDILDISKIEADLLKVDIEPCDVYQVIDQVSGLVRIEIEKRGMSFVTDFQEGLPPAMADRDRLIQVLMNLLNNAVKFTREKSRITLSCRKSGNFIEFGVGDEGTGIPQDALPTLFGRFIQLDSTLVRRVGGTGLGLYISRNLVEVMGGTIWVESKLGEGSVFKFKIPVKKE